jgi:dienelactone hydrolase
MKILPAATALTLALLHSAAHANSIRVSFPGPDGVTLTGFVFAPSSGGKHPAVVMMHGRGGAYSSRAKGEYGAATLSKRHKFWGETWAAQGYVAILVDDFGPRGYAAGFPRFSYKNRPEAVNEVTVRPRDAQAALAYLRTRVDVLGDRIGLQGWSNGGSAALASMAEANGAGEKGFRGALAFYPACRLKGQFDGGIKPGAPVRVFMGAADEEVSPKRCAAFVEKSRAAGGDVSIQLYPGASHGFDDPSVKRASIAANAAAARDATARAIAFFGAVLKP